MKCFHSIYFVLMSIPAVLIGQGQAMTNQMNPLSKEEIYQKASGINVYPAYIGYVQIESIRPGQIRYSQTNVDSKIQAAIKKGALKKMADGRYEPQYFSHTSTLMPQEALPVVLGPKNIGIVLVDGHHDTLSSLQRGASTIPIKVIADLSNLSPLDFWNEASRRNLIYPYDITGKFVRELPAAWSWGSRGNLQDDTNRYFAAITARKCNQKNDTPEKSTGADYPLWIKVGKDIPFIEFMISDALTKAGIKYANDMGEKLDEEPLKSLVESARTALRNKPISGLKLVPNRTLFTDINKGDLCGFLNPFG